jgi:hypothetical protein
VTLYLLPSINRKLRPKLLRELRTGSRIVSNYFDMDDWKPDSRVETWGRILYLWVVPVCVEGRWKCVLNHPDGRRHMSLDLRRKYQNVTGTARVGRREVRIEGGNLVGNHLSFNVADCEEGVRLRCDATVDGAQLRGTCEEAAEEVGREAPNRWAWCGRREQRGATPSCY